MSGQPEPFGAGVTCRDQHAADASTEPNQEHHELLALANARATALIVSKNYCKNWPLG